MRYVLHNKEVVVKTYSMDVRCAVAGVYDDCGSSSEVAEQFGCSESWVRRLIQRRRDHGSLAPRPRRHLADIEGMINGSDLAAPVKKNAVAVFVRLAEAE